MVGSEKAMAPHSSTLAWKIPWTEEPARLQSMGLLRVGHDWATSLSLFLSCIGEGNGSPLRCSCPENPRDGGAWWAAVYGVAESWTRLKRLSSSSSSKTPWGLYIMLNCWRKYTFRGKGRGRKVICKMRISGEQWPLNEEVGLLITGISKLLVTNTAKN